ncbi:MAG: hypothetical protein MK074_01475 [Phycisphaerales bacterium]|nr:hypothetical protein [Phycisphaerales bacterium]
MLETTVIAMLSEAASGISEAPSGLGTELISTLAALATGLVLWAAGGGIMRPAVGALGLGLGALGGWMAWQQTGIGPMWALPAGSALVTCCVALLAWHLASGVLLSALAGLLAGSVAWGAIHIDQGNEVAPPPIQALFGLAPMPVDSTNDDATITPVLAPAATPSLNPSDLAEAAVRAHTQEFADQLAAQEDLAPVRAAWDTVPAEPRLVILIATAAAALLGLLIAALAQSLAAVLLTAIGGALLVVASVPRLVTSISGMDPGFSPSTTALLAVGAWAGMSVLGMAIQAATKKKPAPQAAPAAA